MACSPRWTKCSRTKTDTLQADHERLRKRIPRQESIVVMIAESLGVLDPELKEMYLMMAKLDRAQLLEDLRRNL